MNKSGCKQCRLFSITRLHYTMHFASYIDLPSSKFMAPKKSSKQSNTNSNHLNTTHQGTCSTTTNPVGRATHSNTRVSDLHELKAPARVPRKRKANPHSLLAPADAVALLQKVRVLPERPFEKAAGKSIKPYYSIPGRFSAPLGTTAPWHNYFWSGTL